jgi:hypothetical protein
MVWSVVHQARHIGLFAFTACILFFCYVQASLAQTETTRDTIFEARVASAAGKLGWTRRATPDQGTLYVSPQSFLTNGDLAGATARVDALGRALVVVSLKTPSGVKLMAATARKEHTHIVMLINGQIVATLPASGPMTGKRLAMTGFKHIDDAKRVAALLEEVVR